jgi:hypothetical protein
VRSGGSSQAQRAEACGHLRRAAGLNVQSFGFNSVPREGTDGEGVFKLRAL